MLLSQDIHMGAQNYATFCEYAGVTVEQVNRGSRVVRYDNSIVKGSVCWTYHSSFGHIWTVVKLTADELHDKFYYGPNNRYSFLKRDGVIRQYDFERWINDQILLTEKPFDGKLGITK